MVRSARDARRLIARPEDHPDGYEIVRYRPELEAGVLALLTTLWGPDRRLNAAHFDWKYARNPHGRDAPPMIHVALHEGQPVGMRGMQATRLQIGRPSQTLPAFGSGDLAVLPAHRHRGLVGRILEAQARDAWAAGAPYVFSLSAGVVTQMALLNTGWRCVGPIEVAHRLAPAASPIARLARRLDRGRVVGRLARRLPARDPFTVLDRSAGRHRAEGIDVSRLPRPAAMADLVARLGTDGRLRVVRDQALFAWRFQSPRSRFRFLFHGAETLNGYLVLRSARGRRAHVQIVDWEGTDARVRGELLEAALRWGAFEHLAAWSTSLPADTRSLLERLGFVAEPPAPTLTRAFRTGTHRPAVFLRAADPETAGAADWRLAERTVTEIANWDLRMIYSDGI